MHFEDLVNQHKDAVYRQMIRVCGNRADAEDVLIDALLNAYKRLDQLRNKDAFRSWLAQIARRVCWQLKERESLLPLLQISELEDHGQGIPDPEPLQDDDLAARELKKLLTGAVEGLPPEYREVYQLRELEDLSGEEVASRLGISLAAMKSRLHRARELLRERLEAALQGQ